MGSAIKSLPSPLPLTVVNGGTGAGAAAAARTNLNVPVELNYTQITAQATITATTEGGADTVITGPALTFDGATTIMIEVFAPYITPDNGAANRTIYVMLYDAAVIGYINVTNVSVAFAQKTALYGAMRITPSAGVHTYIVKAYVNAGSGYIGANVGGSNYCAAYMRITRVATLT